MRYLVAALFSAVSSFGAVVLQASCTVPWAVFPDTFAGFPAGTQVPGSGGTQNAVLYGPGSASVGCASTYPDGTAVPISAEFHVAAGSLSGAVPVVNVGSNPSYSGATDFSGTYDQASISGFLLGQTAGPVRPGFLYLTGSSELWSFHQRDEAVVTVAGYTVVFNDPRFGPLQTQGPLPVTLGVPFTITVDRMNGFVGFPSEGDFIYASVDWRFTELNDAPVASTILVTPEPSTFLLAACALFAGAMLAAAGRAGRAS